jgi:membrane protein implicated in regulation of membrane protease activity
MIRGEYWSAYSDKAIAKESRVRVIRVENLKVKVEPIEK